MLFRGWLLIMPSAVVPRARCNSRVVADPHLPSTFNLATAFADECFTCALGFEAVVFFGVTFEASPPFTIAKKSAHFMPFEPLRKFRGQFLPLQRLCWTTFIIEMPSSFIIFRVSFAAFSTAFRKSPSELTHISIAIDSILPPPRPSPACQHLTECGYD